MGKEYFVYEKDKEKRIGWITFNRPEKQNVGGIDDLQHFRPLLREIEMDDDVKVLVLRGAGPCFGSGFDITQLGVETVGFSRNPKDPPPTVRRRLLYERRMAHPTVDGFGVASMFHFVKPCICQVHGYCYGWHFQVATQADIIIASEEALFTHPAFRYIAEPFHTMAWMNDLGYHKTAELVFTGRPFTAEEMYIAGMVNRVVPKERLADEVLEYASVIAKLSLDILMVQKHYLATLRALRHDSFTGDMIGQLAHMSSTFMKPEPGDFLILREAAKGASDAIRKKEGMYPPRWRLNYKDRAGQK